MTPALAWIGKQGWGSSRPHPRLCETAFPLPIDVPASVGFLPTPLLNMGVGNVALAGASGFGKIHAVCLCVESSTSAQRWRREGAVARTADRQGPVLAMSGVAMVSQAVDPNDGVSEFEGSVERNCTPPAAGKLNCFKMACS